MDGMSAGENGSSERGVEALLSALAELVSAAEASCAALVREAEFTTEDARRSARNFAAYIGVRRSDIRELQRDLHRLGLSSLGRIETHAMDSLASVCTILARRTAGLLGPRQSSGI